MRSHLEYDTKTLSWQCQSDSKAVPSQHLQDLVLHHHCSMQISIQYCCFALMLGEMGVQKSLWSFQIEQAPLRCLLHAHPATQMTLTTSGCHSQPLRPHHQWSRSLQNRCFDLNLLHLKSTRCYSLTDRKLDKAPYGFLAAGRTSRRSSQLGR